MRVPVLFLAMAISSPALADNLANVDDTKRICTDSAAKFAAGDPSASYSVLQPYWPLPKEEIQNLAYQTTAQLGMVGGRFGEPLGAEHLETKVSGSSLVKHVFLIKYERHALRFSCVFYKPKNEWLLNSVVWDDKPQNMFQQ